MKSPLIVSSTLIAAVVWLLGLIADPAPLDGVSVLLVGIGLVSMAAVATVGIVLSGGRWARRFALTTLASCLAVAAIRPIDAWWFAGLAATALAFASLYLPSVTDRVRKLPSAAGPPPRAVMVPLMLISTPFVIGITNSDGEAWAAALVSTSALIAAFLYSRAVTGSVVTVRLAWPALALGLSPFIGLPGSLASAVAGVAVAVVAWHPSVSLAVHPSVEAGTGYSIPPELTPTEILDAAQLDDRGKRK